MKIRQIALVLSVTLSSSLAFADAADVKTVCAADVKTAGCEGKALGEGLLKCLGTYKKAHTDFVVSSACKDAMKAALQSAGDAAGVKTACAADVKTAGCDGKEMGTGLAVCLRMYKKTHQDFVVSSACKDAMKAATHAVGDAAKKNK